MLAHAIGMAPPELPPPPPPADEAEATGPLALDLEWNAPATCPTGERVTTAIASLLARRVDLDPTGALRVRGDVTRVTTGWHLELSIDAPSGTEQRRLDAIRCEALTDAAALVIATSVDPRRVAQTLATPRTDVAPTVAPTVETAEPVVSADTLDGPPAMPSRARARPRVHADLGVLAGPALGLTPQLTGWLQGDVLLVIGKAGIGVHGGHAFARAGSGSATARVGSTQIGARGCYVLQQRAFTVPLCGVFEIGATAATGRGANVRTASASSLWVGAGIGTRVQWAPYPRVGLVAGGDALVAIRQPRFHVAGPEGDLQVFRAAPAVLRVTGGVIVRVGGIRRRR
jgi:hypothetical protein